MLRLSHLATNVVKTTEKNIAGRENKFIYIRPPKFFTMHEKEDFNVDFLDQEKLKKQEDKIKSGEIVCNIKDPEDCESCSG